MRANFHFVCAPPLAEVRVGGDLDLDTREQLRDVLACAAFAGCTRLELDMKDVTFVDAGCLRLLDQERSRLVRIGGSLDVVAGSHAYVLVCDLAGYEKLQVVTDAEAASALVPHDQTFL